MKSSLLTLAMLISASQVAAEGPYVAKGWCWVDPQDKQGKWDPFRAEDKALHSLVGGIAGSWVYMYADRNGWKHPEWWGVAASLVIGYLKEVYDIRRGYGTGERADIVATTLGGVAGVTLVRVKW